MSGSGRALVFLENSDQFILKLPELEIISEWHERRDSNGACASPADGRFFILAEPQGRLRIYRNEEQEAHRVIHAEHIVTKYNQAYQKTGTAREMVPVTAVECSIDGTWFASGSRSGGVLLWNTESVFATASDSKYPPAQEWLIEGPINGLAFSNTNQQLFAASGDNKVYSMDLHTMQQRLIAEPGVEVRSIRPSPDGALLAIGSQRGELLIHQIEKPQWNSLPFLICKPRPAEEIREYRTKLEELYDSAASALREERYIDCADRAEQAIGNLVDDPSEMERFQGLLARIPTRRRRILAVSLAWNVVAPKVRPGTPPPHVLPFLNSVAVSVKDVIAVGTDAGVRWFNARTGEPMPQECELPQVRQVAYDHQTDRWLVCALFGAIGLLPLTGIAEVFRTKGNMLNTAVPIRGSRRAVAACGAADGSLVFWSGTEKVEVIRAMAHSIETVAVSPDSTWLAAAGLDGILGCIDIATARPIGVVKGVRTSAIRCAAFHPNGELLASAGDDACVRVWTVARGEVVREFNGGTERMCAVTFSPDGDWLAAGDAAGTIRLWNIRSVEHETVTTPYGEVASLAFDQTGGALVVGHRSGALCKWLIHWALALDDEGFLQHKEELRRSQQARSNSPRPAAAR